MNKKHIEISKYPGLFLTRCSLFKECKRYINGGRMGYEIINDRATGRVFCSRHCPQGDLYEATMLTNLDKEAGKDEKKRKNPAISEKKMPVKKTRPKN
jgi:hypothetical protein